MQGQQAGGARRGWGGVSECDWVQVQKAKAGAEGQGADGAAGAGVGVTLKLDVAGASAPTDASSQPAFVSCLTTPAWPAIAAYMSDVKRRLSSWASVLAPFPTRAPTRAECPP